MSTPPPEGSSGSPHPALQAPGQYVVGPAESVGRRPADQPESAAASRAWWDAEATDYYREHRAVLGDDALMWGPEGVYESDLGLLGEVAGLDVLEFGAGAAQGSRWCAARGARTVATDISGGMLAQGRRLDAAAPGAPAYVLCDAVCLPFADESFDTVFSAYGALPFVADPARLLREVSRVLRVGGRLVFSVTHPIRWTLPDTPGQAGLTVRTSYFDRDPYVEQDAAGRATYVEHHATLGDRVRQIVAAGLHLVDLVEPEWPEHADHVWGGWSRLRGELVPGTAIFVCRKATP
ncbi:methyltransferase domain-containing protein [Ornithinimicrobium sp. F0845]|uniref:class I SAM-dependent methyltransferase n=1 Tax=Ornithinimicrobium sp. F0845 TaxID=2926412 RepID=UPI001FF61F9D|nr:class I SAM-dependent methyltransferase [Ornithinimicrobium sp. F0845]MCK0113811.1 methyltransferase domain-containing protein [Ornithinimicrobium sp. F0845]